MSEETVQTTPETGVQPAPQPANWMSGFSDPDLKGWVENKGFHTSGPEALAKSYRSLEQMVGRKQENLVEVPMTDKPEDWDKFYNRLGRPETADKYGMSLPENGNNEMFQWAKTAFHKYGLTNKQATDLFNDYLGFEKSYIDNATNQHNLTLETDKKELQRTWGQANDKNTSVARGAAIKFGLNEKDIDVMASSIGYKRTMEVLYNIGAAVGESQFVGSSDSKVVSASNAKMKEQELLSNPLFRKAFIAGEQQAVETITNLRKMQLTK